MGVTNRCTFRPSGGVGSAAGSSVGWGGVRRSLRFCSFNPGKSLGGGAVVRMSPYRLPCSWPPCLMDTSLHPTPLLSSLVCSMDLYTSWSSRGCLLPPWRWWWLTLHLSRRARLMKWAAQAAPCRAGVMISEPYCSCVQRSVLMFQTLPEERSRVKTTKVDPSLGPMRWMRCLSAVGWLLGLRACDISQIPQEVVISPSVAPLGQCGLAPWYDMLEASIGRIRGGRLFMRHLFENPSAAARVLVMKSRSSL